MEYGFYHPDRGYWQTIGKPSRAVLATYPEGYQEVPVQPTADHVLNVETLSWEYTPPSPEALLAEWRAGATSPKKDFCIACATTGVLPAEEAVLAAQGGWPATFSDALGSLPAGDQAAAQITWATANNVHRSDPLLIAVQAAKDMADEEVDALFGGAP